MYDMVSWLRHKRRGEDPIGFSVDQDPAHLKKPDPTLILVGRKFLVLAKHCQCSWNTKMPSRLSWIFKLNLLSEKKIQVQNAPS